MVGRYYQYRMTVQLVAVVRSPARPTAASSRRRRSPTSSRRSSRTIRSRSFEDGLTGKYQQREYCVQYRETDFDFVSRLMEEEGIYYYFDHQDGRHVLKLVDSDSGHKALEHKATIAYYPPGKEVRADEEYIHAWTFAQSIQPGDVALTDYDFTKPKADLTSKAKLIQKHEQRGLRDLRLSRRIPRGGRRRPLRARARRRAPLRVRARRGRVQRARDRGRAALFNLTNAPRADQEREYLIVGAEYELQDNAYETLARRGRRPTTAGSPCCRAGSSSGRPGSRREP